jgi:hypothetical protein
MRRLSHPWRGAPVLVPPRPVLVPCWSRNSGPPAAICGQPRPKSNDRPSGDSQVRGSFCEAAVRGARRNRTFDLTLIRAGRSRDVWPGQGLRPELRATVVPRRSRDRADRRRLRTPTNPAWRRRSGLRKPPSPKKRSTHHQTARQLLGHERSRRPSARSTRLLRPGRWGSEGCSLFDLKVVVLVEGPRVEYLGWCQ